MSQTKSPVTLQVVDDSNDDGVPSQGERIDMPSGGSIFADGVVEGITLVVGAFPQKEPVEVHWYYSYSSASG